MDAKTDTKEKWFRKCLILNESPLLNYVIRILISLEPSQDVVQDSFLKLWEQKYPSELENYPRAWLFRVSRNAAIDFLRRDKKQVRLEEGIELQTCMNEELLDMSIILSRIDKLSNSTKEVMILKFQEDLSYKEISKITGLTVSNVGYKIHEGLNEVRIALEAGEEK